MVWIPPFLTLKLGGFNGICGPTRTLPVLRCEEQLSSILIPHHQAPCSFSSGTLPSSWFGSVNTRNTKHLPFLLPPDILPDSYVSSFSYLCRCQLTREAFTVYSYRTAKSTGFLILTSLLFSALLSFILCIT